MTHNDLGLALRRQGNLAEASAESRAAIGFKPDYAAAHYYLGDVLHALGKSDETIAEFRKVRGHAPSGSKLAEPVERAPTNKN